MSGRFAVLHPYRDKAENETAVRIVQAAANLGLEAVECLDSDAVMEIQPDFVLSLSHQDAKLTPFPTYGVLTAPKRYYQTPRFLRNILSYDAYFTVSDSVRMWLEDLTFGARKHAAPVGFYANTAPQTPFVAWRPPASLQLAYFGTNWDGARHGALFQLLAERTYVRFFGPAMSWQNVPQAAYGGSPPFDGVSSLESYRKAGAGLCLDLPDFIVDGLPTNRIFEITAAGVPAVCSDNLFVRRWFGDDVLYIDPEAPPDVQVRQIDAHMAWIAADPAAAGRMAQAAHERFSRDLALERLLPNVLTAHERVLTAKGYRPSPAEPQLPTLACIVRTGDRSEAMLRRALTCLRAQRHHGLRTILVVWARAPWLERALADFADLNFEIIDAPGAGRSAALWAGLRAAQRLSTAFFACLDDDDEIFSNHYRSLFNTLRRYEQAFPDDPPQLCYSACVEAADEPFDNDVVVDASSLSRREKRRMQQFHFHPPGRLSERSFVCASMTFIARTTLLTDETLEDPGLETAEDLYLWLLLAERTRFAFSCEATACARRHGEGQSDYANPVRWEPAYQRIFLRMFGRSFPASTEYGFLPGGRRAEMDPRLFALLPPAETAPAVGRESDAPVPLTLRADGDGLTADLPHLAVGVYDVEIYAAGVGTFNLTVFQRGRIAAQGLLEENIERDRGFPCRLLRRRVPVPPFLAAGGGRLDLTPVALEGCTPTIVGAALRRRAGFPRCRLDELPDDRQVWIYGAGEGGRIMLDRLLRTPGVRVAGFMDRTQRGSVGGRPTLSAAEVLSKNDDVSVVVASQYWREILVDLDALGARNVYCAYPFDQGDLAVLR